MSGRERIGWTQTAEAPGELSGFRYALYVDNERRVLEGETCSIASDGGSADCSAPLPALGAGLHSLELSAFFMSGDTLVEGARSPVLQITVAGAIAAPADRVVQGGEFQSSDGIRLRAEILAHDLVDPNDLAATDDGRIFVAERGGRLRMFGAAPVSRGDDNLLADLGERPATSGAVLLSVALAPDFRSSGLLHVAYLTPQRDRAMLQIVRLREVRGLLGQPAVVASYPLPSAEVSAIVRFSPDGRLHVGIGTGPNPSEAQSLAGFSGKILRLRPDGTTPEDNRANSPIMSTGHRDPRGLAWLPPDHSLWEVERDERGDEINRIQAGANYGFPLARQRASLPGMIPPAFILQAGSESSGLTTITTQSSPFFGDLIVSSLADRDLLRFRVTQDGRLQLMGRLLQGRFGQLAQVAASGDGSLFFITRNGEQGTGQEALVRVSTDVPTPHTPRN